MRLLIALMSAVCLYSQIPGFDGFRHLDDAGNPSLTDIYSTKWSVARGGPLIGTASASSRFMGIGRGDGLGGGFPVVAQWYDNTGLGSDQFAAGAVYREAGPAIHIGATYWHEAVGGSLHSGIQIRRGDIASGTMTNIQSTCGGISAADFDILELSSSGTTLNLTVRDKDTDAVKATCSGTDSTYTSYSGTKVGWSSHGGTTRGLDWWVGGNAGITLPARSARKAYYASEDAPISGADGSEANPYPFYYLIARPELITATAGYEIVLRAGTYDNYDRETLKTPDGIWPMYFPSSQTNPFTLRAYPGESVIMSVQSAHKCAIRGPSIGYWAGDYATFRDIHFTGGDMTGCKLLQSQGSNFPWKPVGGFRIDDGEFNKFINVTISHVGDALTIEGANAQGNEFLDSHIYAVGWDSTDRRHGSGSYMRNASSTNTLNIKRSCVRDATYQAWRATGGNAGVVDGVVFDYACTLGPAKTLITQGWPQGLIQISNGFHNGGVQTDAEFEPQDLRVTNNFFVLGGSDQIWGQNGPAFGIGAITHTGNKIDGRVIFGVTTAWPTPYTGSGTVTSNINSNQLFVNTPSPFGWKDTGTTNYRALAAWQSFGTSKTGAQFDAAGSHSTSNPGSNWVWHSGTSDKVPGNGLVILRNWTSATSHSFDLSSLGFTSGDPYQVEDYWCPSCGVIASGTYTGSTISLDLTRTNYDSPVAGVSGYGTQAWNTGQSANCTAMASTLGWQSGAGAPGGGCTPCGNPPSGSCLYLNTSNNQQYYCSTGGSWTLSESTCAIHTAYTYARESTQPAFLVKRQQTYRSATRVSIPYRSGATTAIVTWGLTSAGPFDFGPPSESISVGGPGPAAASIPQPIGAAYYKITYSDGYITPALKAVAR